MSAHPLLRDYPRLAAALPVAGLLAGPTPVAPLAGAPGVFVKRDDLSAPDYGGNKVRKLDFLLADARARGARELLTFGYTGSNFVAATAWHGRKLDLRTIGYLLRQVDADYIADNLAVGLHCGAELHLLGGTARIGAAALWRSARGLLRQGRLPAWIPPGGSSPLGTVGFVNAAWELKGQVAAGQLPEPEAIYVAFSSMGTVAGLALGLELAGLKTRIEAVQVVGPRFASPPALRRLVLQTGALLARCDADLSRLDAGRALARVRIRGEFFGAEYARPAAGTKAAMRRFLAAGGVRADSCYSGKALDALYHDLDAGALRGTTLFWHTLSARGLPPGVAHPPPDEVPTALRAYFRPA